MGDNYPYNRAPPPYYGYGNNTQQQGYNIYQPMNPNYFQNDDRPDAPSMGPPPGPPPAVRQQIPSMAPPSRPPPGPNNNMMLPPPNRPPLNQPIPTFTPMINTPYANAMKTNTMNQNRPPPAPGPFNLNDGYSNYPSPATTQLPPRKEKGRKNERKKTRARIDADSILTPSAQKLKEYSNMLPYTPETQKPPRKKKSFDDQLVKKNSKNKNGRNGNRRRKNSKNDSSYGSYGENDTPMMIPPLKNENSGPPIPMFSPAPSFATEQSYQSYQTYGLPNPNSISPLFVVRGAVEENDRMIPEVKRKKKVRRKQKLNKFSDRKLETYNPSPTRNSPQKPPRAKSPNPYGKPKPKAYVAKKSAQKNSDTLSFEGSSRQIAQTYNAPALSPNKKGEFPPLPPPRRSDENSGLRTKSLGLQIMVSKKFGRNPDKLRPISPQKAAPPPLPDRRNKPVPSQLYTPAPMPPPSRGRNNAPPGLGWSRFLGPV